MCSILGILCLQGGRSLRSRAIDLSRRQRHRGPDEGGAFSDETAVLVQDRLAIVDVAGGHQPFRNEDVDGILIVNGEIYNHSEIAVGLPQKAVLKTGSDCEVILPFIDQAGPDRLAEVNGIFAFILYEPSRKRFLIARDPMGVVPLYYGFDQEEILYVASEMKTLVGVCDRIEDFPPGHYWYSDSPRPIRFYDPSWRSYAQLEGTPADLDEIRESLTAAVERQLMGEAPYGVLISGGLDSSIIAALAKQKARREDLYSFAVGLEGSPDLAAARIVAEYLGTIHHELHFTIEEGFDALREVIYFLETFDVTTIRAATPMYLMARRVRSHGIKVVLSGEGADEIFGGYLYFHKAPNAREFHEETVRKLDRLYKFDCLRANKSMAAWGVEARVPFLDLEFLDVAMGFDAEHKMIRPGRMEKDVLRRACDDLLPADIIQRQKEQFSDGVGYDWIDSLKQLAQDEVSDVHLQQAGERYPINPPTTKEAYLYRSAFERLFPGTSPVRCVPDGPSIACSTPTAIAWDKGFETRADPSGRAIVGIHQAPLDE